MGYKVRFIDYTYWYELEKKQIDHILTDCLYRGQLMLRDEVERFEANLASYVGTEFAVGISNCTDALRLALLAAGVQPGDEVITSAHTFAATVASIHHVGALPVVVDINPGDHLINVDSVVQRISSKTKVIIPVSLNGRCANLHELENIADKEGILVLEDAAQGLGAKRNGKMPGSHGIGGCFSFYPAKTLGSLGDAGAFTTNSKDLYNKMMLLRNHNRESDGDIRSWGYNCRIDNIQAAILDFRLSQIEKYIQKRREIAAIYFEELKDVGEVILPPNDRNDDTNRDVFQNFEFKAEFRDQLLSFLRNEGVEIILPWGGKAIHHHSAYTGCKDQLTETDSFFKKIMTLPMHIALTEDEARFVSSKVKQFYAKNC